MGQDGLLQPLNSSTGKSPFFAQSLVQTAPEYVLLQQAPLKMTPSLTSQQAVLCKKKLFLASTSPVAMLVARKALSRAGEHGQEPEGFLGDMAGSETAQEVLSSPLHLMKDNNIYRSLLKHDLIRPQTTLRKKKITERGSNITHLRSEALATVGQAFKKGVPRGEISCGEHMRDGGFVIRGAGSYATNYNMGPSNNDETGQGFGGQAAVSNKRKRKQNLTIETEIALKKAKLSGVIDQVIRVAERAQKLLFAGTSLVFIEAVFYVPSTDEEASEIKRRGTFHLDNKSQTSDLYFQSWSHTQFFAAQITALGLRYLKSNIRVVTDASAPPAVWKWLKFSRLNAVHPPPSANIFPSKDSAPHTFQHMRSLP